MTTGKKICAAAIVALVCSTALDSGLVLRAQWPSISSSLHLHVPLGANSLRREPAIRNGDSSSLDPSGWVDIVPHGTLKGWTRVAIPPDKPLDPANQWSVSDGTIICEGNHGHEWLRYDRELANFLLHVEWRFEKREGLAGYNSGVFVRNDREGRVWLQAQVGRLAFIFGQTLYHGELSPIVDEMWKDPPAEVNPLHPVGEWNTYEIRCDGVKITLSVNGELTGQFEAPEVPKGYIGLEAEGYHIEFRSIKFKTLP